MRYAFIALRNQGIPLMLILIHFLFINPSLSLILTLVSHISFHDKCTSSTMNSHALIWSVEIYEGARGSNTSCDQTQAK